MKIAQYMMFRRLLMDVGVFCLKKTKPGMNYISTAPDVGNIRIPTPRGFKREGGETK
jgi:hypothetical protein